MKLARGLIGKVFPTELGRNKREEKYEVASEQNILYMCMKQSKNLYIFNLFFKRERADKTGHNAAHLGFQQWTQAAGRSGAHGHPQLYRKLEANLGYRKPCLNKDKQKCGKGLLGPPGNC